MSNIHRTYDAESQVYFVTTNTYRWVKWFQASGYAQLAVDQILHLEKRGDCRMIAYVVMPDHLHILIEIIGRKNISELMHDLKSRIAYKISLSCRQIFSVLSHTRSCHASGDRRGVPALSQVEGAASPMGERKFTRIWQRSFYDRGIRDERDLENHINYIHWNPVKHGYVTKPEDWLWSSYCKNKRMALRNN